MARNESIMNLKRIVFGVLLAGAAAACSSGSEGGKNGGGVLTLGTDRVEMTYEAGASESFILESEGDWGSAVEDKDWCTVSPSGGVKGRSEVRIVATENRSNEPRQTTVTFRTAAGERKPLTVVQDYNRELDEVKVPDGYKLVWHDEFDTEGESLPSSDWWYETGGGGWGNNELQTYVAGETGGRKYACVSDGTLKITAAKSGGKIYSIRMNTVEGYTYGYFEARLKLPKGKGTWPAFWMMPKNFVSWPGSGEIDIMEEVGCVPNRVSSSIHCDAYNHAQGTQKTHEILIESAQTEFHTYAVEWTPDYMAFIFDGEEHFRFLNDKAGNNATWPFDAPFYLKLNLAWGGNWGGMYGVDESCLPATYEIDYVRVFQKK